MSDALMLFSVTPVQRFIEAARSVRDLTAGSRILSYMANEAFRAGREAGGTPVYPRPIDGETHASFPNRFVMRCDVEGDVPRVAVEAARRAWQALARDVHLQLTGLWQSAHPDWDQKWQEQIDSFWEFHTVVLPAAECSEARRLLLGGEPPRADLGGQLEVLQRLLSAQKMVRHFPGDDGIGRMKCALLGELEQMGPRGLGEGDTFWRDVSQSYDGLFLKTNDRLCAVSLVKRFCPWHTAASGLAELAHSVPDTAAIATKAWWQDAEGDERTAFEGALALLDNTLGAQAEIERRYLLMDDLSPKALAEDTNLLPSSFAEASEALRTTREALLKATREGIGAPPRYYAVLVMDGDHIGKWLTGAMGGRHGAPSYSVDDEFLSDFSGKLALVADQTPSVVDEHNGHPVYSGGDDALALLPLSAVLGCAAELRERYTEAAPFGAGDCFTASAGIAIAHYRFDLRAALRAARSAAREAKDFGRNALTIRLLKHSGSEVAVHLPWDSLPRFTCLKELFAAGVTDRWLDKLYETLEGFEEIAPDLAGTSVTTPPAGAVDTLVKHSLRRLQLSSEEKMDVAGVLSECCNHETEPDHAEDASRELIAGMWGEWRTMLAKRHERASPDGDDPLYPHSGHPAFLRTALRQFLDGAFVASFLTRGRD